MFIKVMNNDKSFGSKHTLRLKYPDINQEWFALGCHLEPGQGNQIEHTYVLNV